MAEIVEIVEIVEHEGKKYERRDAVDFCEGCAFYQDIISACAAVGHDHMQCTFAAPGSLKVQNYIFVEVK
jgi:hypothetical protein